MSFNTLTGKTPNKKDEYLLKFQKYKEQKENQKKGQREQPLQKIDATTKQNTIKKCLPKTEKKINSGLKPQSSETKDRKCKENNGPVVKSLVNTEKPTVTSKKQITSNVTDKVPFSRKSGSLFNSGKVESKTKSALNVRKSVGSVGSLHSTDVKPRKSVSNVESLKPRKPESGTVQQKSNRSERKSVGRVVESRLFQHVKSQNVNNKDKPAVQQKPRRHSDLNKKQTKPKPASILKRKSCFASLTCDVFSEINGKTPDHGRSVRFISPDLQENFCSATHLRKTPKRPALEDRQPTPMQLAKKPRLHDQQAEMRNKLDEWLKSKGKTPSKFRHLMCFHDEDNNNKVPITDSCIKRSLTVEELTEQKATIDREDNIVINLADQFRDSALEELDSMLDECTTLYDAGCPRDDILRWLDSIEQNIKLSKTYAKFYICKARVLKSSENLEKVLQVYEDAVVNGAQPSTELASSLTGIVKDICQDREKKARQKSAADVQEENIFESSVIKYTVRQVTPFSKKRRRSASDVKPSSPCAVVTPVRRSTRRSIACLPTSLQDKTPTYRSLKDMSDQDKKKSLFVPNEALPDQDNM